MKKTVLAMFLAGCSPNPDAYIGATGATGVMGATGPAGSNGMNAMNQIVSGSRIKVHKLTTADGMIVSNGLYDSQLQVDCAPTILEDGKTYCAPINLPMLFPEFYTDPACSNLGVFILIPRPPCGGIQHYAHRDNGCNSNTKQVFSLSPYTGDKYQAGPGAGDCVLYSDSGGGTYYSITPLNASTTFAEITDSFF